MRAELVDPRYATGRDDDPEYRVDFWTGWSMCEEWLLTKGRPGGDRLSDRVCGRP